MSKVHFKAFAKDNTAIHKIKMNGSGKQIVVRCKNHNPKFEEISIFDLVAIEDRCDSDIESTNVADVFEVLKNLENVTVYAVTESGRSTDLNLKFLQLKDHQSVSVPNVGSMTYDLDYILPEKVNVDILYDTDHFEAKVPDPMVVSMQDVISSIPEVKQPTKEEIREIFSAAAEKQKEVIETPVTAETAVEEKPHQIMSSEVSYTRLMPGDKFNLAVKDMIFCDLSMIIKTSTLTDRIKNFSIISKEPSADMPHIVVSTIEGKECRCYYDEKNSALYLYTEADEIRANTDMHSFLRGFQTLRNPEAVRYIDFSDTINISSMFYSTGIDKTDFMKNTTFVNVRNMNSLFKNCKSLKSVSGMDGFNWGMVQYEEEICYGCSSLKNYPEKHWKKGFKKSSSSR